MILHFKSICRLTRKSVFFIICLYDFKLEIKRFLNERKIINLIDIYLRDDSKIVMINKEIIRTKRHIH